MRKGVSRKLILAACLSFSIIFSDIFSLQGRIFAQTLPFTYIKPPASSISLFIVAETLLAPEVEALILSLGGTVASATVSTSFLPISSSAGQIHQISFSLSLTAAPPAEVIQFTVHFPDPYAACPILSTSPAICFVGIIISPFYGSATGHIEPGGTMDGVGTHRLVDQVTGETICMLSISNPLFLIKYPGALIRSVTVSGTLTTLVEWFPPYFLMEVEDISFPSEGDPGPNILTPLLTGFGSLPFFDNFSFHDGILNQPFNFINPINPGLGWGDHFMPSLLRFMPSYWPGIIPWFGIFGGWMPQPMLSYGLSFPYPFNGGNWPDFNSPPSDLELSNWIWTSPTTAYNPNTPSGFQQAYFVSIAAGYEQESPYYQQNFDEIYKPVYMPGIGTVYPYQSITNPFSPLGFSTLIPDYGWWPNISLGGFLL